MLPGTIFAYGQTAAGKTFTMQGAGKQRGLLQLASEEMFARIADTPDREFLIRCSYVEIYNERIRDLLHPDTPELKVHESVKKGVHLWPPPQEMMITDPSMVQSASKKGNKKRSVGATDMNAHSSRSHTIFRIVVESRERKDDRRTSEDDVDAVLVGTLTLVDLAGSESVRLTGAVRCCAVKFHGFADQRPHPAPDSNVQTSWWCCTDRQASTRSGQD